MRKIINIPEPLVKKIEYYQNEVFYHQFTTSTITTLIGLGIKYLEENREFSQPIIPNPYWIPRYPPSGQRTIEKEKENDSK